MGRLVSRETTDGVGLDSSSATWDYVVPGDVDEATDLGLLSLATSKTVTTEGLLETKQGESPRVWWRV